jgi:NDP-sugar pyrophosphorylase family protein
MHVIIPMAGHSRRFRAQGFASPKWMLMVGDKPMIEHVVGMFTETDEFHFIVTREQADQGPGVVSYLNDLVAKGHVHIIDSHEEGPIQSVMGIENIPADAPVIISYCDFFVHWDYQVFLRHLHSADGAVVTFSGFQAASFGNTQYAYLRIDGDRMLELQEKQSFTDDRVSEPASAGIYYFSQFATFLKYGRQVLDDENRDLPESYVSLAYNHLIEDGLRVITHEAEIFVCLGTPEDYEQYQYWWQYFVGSSMQKVKAENRSARVNLIPMAGEGARFREYGYRVAKPLIQIGGLPMVMRTLQSMPEADDWLFVPRFTDIQTHPIEKALRKFAPDCQIFPCDTLTTGPAATCLLARAGIVPEAELMIASCDYEHRYDHEAWGKIINDPDIDGAIWTYRLGANMVKSAEAFAYCRTEAGTNRVREVVEKQIISDTPGNDPLVVGTFWFRRGEDFIRGAESMIASGNTINGEHYVGTSINQLIAEGARFVIFDINQWISFGDPFELKLLEFWEKVFGTGK